MLHQKTLTVPAGTLITAPVSSVLELAYGVSTRREVYFPDGCHALCHVRVDYLGAQIIPWSRDEWLASDGGVVVDDSTYAIEDSPEEFTIYAYNDDTVNAHTITLRVQMVTGAIPAGLAKFVDLLKRIGVI